MNIFLLFLSFLNFSSNRFIEKEVEYQETLYQYNDYYIIDNDEYELYFQEELIRTYENNTQIKLITVNQKTYVFSILDNMLSIDELDQSHKLLTTKTFEDLFYKEFNIYYYNNYLYFVGGINDYKSTETIDLKKDYFGKTDGIIFSLDKDLNYRNIYIFGGELNEYFFEAIFYDKQIYLMMKKDMLSGGDFGFGGGNDASYVLALMNKDFKLINYVTLKNEHFKDLIIDEDILIATDSNFYRLNLQLTLEESVKFPFKSVFVHLTPNKSAILFNQSQAKIYDFEKRKYVCDISYESIESVKIDKDAFVFDNSSTKRSFKIYDLINVPNSYIYNAEIVKPVINDMFKEIDADIGEINPYFNPLIYGNYQVEYLFDDIKINRKINVPFSVNVSEGIIYPLRYNLRFTGTALLNNIQIMNNHSIANQGLYRLELISCNQEIRVINFEVFAEQIMFSESPDKHWDYVINQNDSLLLQIPYEIDERFEIVSAWINDDSYPCIYENGLLKVELPTEIAGIKTFTLQAITYLLNDNLYDYQIDQEFIVNILRDDLEIYTEVSNVSKDINFQLDINDPNNCLRGISIILINNGKENRYRYPIAAVNLDFPPSGRREEATICLNYDQGDGVLKEVPLFKVNIESKSRNFSIGTLNIVEMRKNNYRLAITIPTTKSILEISTDNDIIYCYLEDDYTANISMGILIGISSMIIIRGFRKRINKRKKLNKK